MICHELLKNVDIYLFCLSAAKPSQGDSATGDTTSSSAPTPAAPPTNSRRDPRLQKTPGSDPRGGSANKKPRLGGSDSNGHGSTGGGAGGVRHKTRGGGGHHSTGRPAKR